MHWLKQIRINNQHEHLWLLEMCCTEINQSQLEFKIHYKQINRIKCKDYFHLKMLYRLINYKIESMLEDLGYFPRTRLEDREFRI